MTDQEQQANERAMQIYDIVEDILSNSADPCLQLDWILYTAKQHRHMMESKPKQQMEVESNETQMESR